MKLSVKECLLFGWNTFKKRPWIFVKAALLLGAISFIFNTVYSLINGGIAMKPDPATTAALMILMVIVSVASVYVGIVLDNMGVTKFYLKAHDAVEGLELKDLWAPHPFVKYVLTSVLYGLSVLVGVILLIIPGIIVAIAFGMALYLVMDRGLGPVEALKESARITRGNRVRLFLLGLAIIGINIVGLLLVFVGLFVTIPVSVLASVHAYRMLSNAPAV